MAAEPESEPLRRHTDGPLEDPEWAEPRLGIEDLRLGATPLDEGVAIAEE